MLFSFFKKDYIVRRFGEETIVNGVSGAPHEDFVVAMEDVQPLSSDELQALPEGERTVRHIKAIGSTAFTTGGRGDRQAWRLALLSGPVV